MSTSSACLGYWFQPNGETFEAFASPIYLLIRYLMQTKTSGERKCKNQELLADIHNSSLNGDAVDIGKAAFKTSLNLLSNTIFSVDLADPNSATGRELSKLVHSILEVGSRPNLADYFPVLKKVDPQGIQRQMTIFYGKMIDLFSSIISQRLLQRKTFGSIRNNEMLDSLLHISEESTGEIDKTQIERLFVVTISLYSSSITTNLFIYALCFWVIIHLCTFYYCGLWSREWN